MSNKKRIRRNDVDYDDIIKLLLKEMDVHIMCV